MTRESSGMRRMGRRRKASSSQADASRRLAYSELCWVMTAGSSEPIAAVQVSVADAQLELTGEALPEQVAAVQAVDRLAQIDLWSCDVDLLFVESANTLAMTTLRFPSEVKAQKFIARIAESYEQRVGARFPQDWLRLHGPRAGAEHDLDPGTDGATT